MQRGVVLECTTPLFVSGNCHDAPSRTTVRRSTDAYSFRPDSVAARVRWHYPQHN
ncbi:hypothetical protein BamMEX5DRAFT_3752 [Burkholderia ambifaria MEX-5]|uniref:Uncharacterized protein n=1 Tax=Burkholderia ambifaria MEX-5 TaxID=396597 RepID=B1T7I6_9BURK|nr:hypothetical protein BamMEX5DRAFT_3752 [Burkholderia ambifaria MEX-5]